MGLTSRSSHPDRQQTSSSCCTGVSRSCIHPNRLLCMTAYYSSSSQCIRAQTALHWVLDTLRGICSGTALGRPIWMLCRSCRSISSLTFPSLTHSVTCSLLWHGHTIQHKHRLSLGLKPSPSPSLSRSHSILSMPRAALGRLRRGCFRLACKRRRAVATCHDMVVGARRGRCQSMFRRSLYWYPLCHMLLTRCCFLASQCTAIWILTWCSPHEVTSGAQDSKHCILRQVAALSVSCC